MTGPTVKEVQDAIITLRKFADFNDYTLCRNYMKCMVLGMCDTLDAVLSARDWKPIKQSQPTLHAGGKAWWTGEAIGGNGLMRYAKAQVVILEEPRCSRFNYNFMLRLDDGELWHTQSEFLTPLLDNTETD